jgi:hypothetical protein
MAVCWHTVITRQYIAPVAVTVSGAAAAVRGGSNSSSGGGDGSVLAHSYYPPRHFTCGSGSISGSSSRVGAIAVVAVAMAMAVCCHTIINPQSLHLWQ